LNRAPGNQINGVLLVYTIPLRFLETGSLKLMKKLTTICLALAFSSCNYQASTNQAAPKELVVAAAANLTDAFAEIGSRFTSRTGIRVVFSFGATAELAKQIENGAPFDVFAAADTEHVDLLDRAGLLTPGTTAIFARGRLVMWLPAGSTLKIERLEDLTAKQFDRIAIAKPDVAPYGHAAVESLQQLGIWTQIEPRVIYAQNVSQARQYAATGNAEVAFIPLALVKPGDGTYVEVKESLHHPINQALGVVESSAKQDAARQFVSFVLSPEGQQLLRAKGYAIPGS
jgi:molybdate transport system substrate-binding protein